MASSACGMLWLAEAASAIEPNWAASFSLSTMVGVLTGPLGAVPISPTTALFTVRMGRGPLSISIVSTPCRKLAGMGQSPFWAVFLAAGLAGTDLSRPSATRVTMAGLSSGSSTVAPRSQNHLLPVRQGQGRQRPL